MHRKRKSMTRAIFVLFSKKFMPPIKLTMLILFSIKSPFVCIYPAFFLLKNMAKCSIV